MARVAVKRRMRGSKNQIDIAGVHEKCLGGGAAKRALNQDLRS